MAEYVANLDYTITATPDINSVGVPNTLNGIPLPLTLYKAPQTTTGLPILVNKLVVMPTGCTMTTFNFYYEYDLPYAPAPEPASPAIDDVYSNNGSNFKILFLMVEDLTTLKKTTICCKRTSGTNNPLGNTLTKVSGSGPSSIIYSLEEHSGNKFVSGMSVIDYSGIVPIYKDLYPLRENDKGTCKGIFTYGSVTCICECEIKIDSAGQSSYSLN